MKFTVTAQGKVGEWEYQDINAAQEYRDVSKDNSSQNTKLQKRNHWIFVRVRPVCHIQQIWTGAGTAIDADVGDSYPSGQLPFFPGGGDTAINPPALLDGEENSVNWTCTSDKLLPAPDKHNYHNNVQVWEAYDPPEWEDVT